MPPHSSRGSHPSSSARVASGPVPFAFALAPLPLAASVRTQPRRFAMRCTCVSTPMPAGAAGEGREDARLLSLREQQWCGPVTGYPPRTFPRSCHGYVRHLGPDARERLEGLQGRGDVSGKLGRAAGGSSCKGACGATTGRCGADPVLFTIIRAHLG